MLKGRTALITGSTSGIGLGIARRLAQEGANIVLNGFGDKDEIEAIRTKLSLEFNINAVYCPADISDPAAVRTLIDFGIGTMGRIDILVNNAGIQFTSIIDDFPDERWNAILATNLSSNFHTIKAVLPHMKSNGWGRIINIASVHGMVGSTTKVAYVAAKHGVLGLTKVVALENAHTNVTCNAICPGWVLTPLVQKQIDERARRDQLSLQNVSQAMLAEKQPSGEFATPEQIGAIAVFLCSDSAKQIRGASIAVDGGWTAQ
jgi:3-hydroxybutyrate dehydrogenase